MQTTRRRKGSIAFVDGVDRIIKPAALTRNDLAKLAVLEPSLQFKFLTTQALHALCGGDYARLVKRCTLLRVHGNQYIRLPKGQRASPNTGYKNFVYELASAGRNALQQAGVPMLEAAHRSNSYYHEIITDLGFYLPLRLAVDADSSLRLITASMLLEHDLTPAPTRRNYTDPFGFRLDPYNPDSKIRRFDGPPFVLVRLKPDATWDNLCVPGIEVDRNANEGITSNVERTTIASHIAEIVQFRERGLHDRYLGFGNKIFVPVLISGETLAQAETHMRNVMHWVQRTYGAIGYIGFQVVPDIGLLEHFPDPSGNIITSAWKRVGHPDLFMTRA